MSLYKQGVATPGYGGSRALVTVVKVNGVIPTPYGNVIAGEVVEGEYFPPGSPEIGWSLKKTFKKVGKGIKKGVVKTAKVVTTPHRLAFKGAKAITKGAVRVTKRTGKAVFKGTKAAVKFAVTKPLQGAAFLATAPLGLAYAGVKAVGKGLKGGLALGKGGGGGGGSAQEETATEETPTEEAYAEEATEVTPESYPGEQYASDEGDQQTPDALEAPEAEEEEYSADEEGEESSEEEEAASEEEGEEEGSESENDAIEGESYMANDEEWVGLDEIAFEDDDVSGDEIAGTSKGKKRPAGINAVQIRKTGYQKARKQPLGFNSAGTVAAGASAVITVAPQTLFRGRRLSVPGDIAPHFTIDNLVVGNQPQFAGGGALPADAFVSNATGNDNLTMDSCPPGLTITMTVTNQSADARQFRSALFGDSAW